MIYYIIILNFVYILIRSTSEFSKRTAWLHASRRNLTCDRRYHCKWDRCFSFSLFTFFITFLISCFSFLYLALENLTTFNFYTCWFIQKVTLLLSSAIVAQWGLDTQDREEVTRDMIGNILRMIMVWMHPFLF